MNFGWPIFEGLENSTTYATINTPNPFAPNPLYQVNGCTQQYFYFQNLIKQATPDGTAVFTNPCSTQSIPSTIPTFVHSRPIIDWAHNAAGPSRTGTFSGQTATVVNIGAAGSPVSGAQFAEVAAIGGVYYTGTDFPEEYRNKLFFGDFLGGFEDIAVKRPGATCPGPAIYQQRCRCRRDGDASYAGRFVLRQFSRRNI